jgi:hypothetical protein
MAVRLSALPAGRPLSPRKIPGTHFCQRLGRPQGHRADGRIRSIEIIHLIGSRSRDLLACSIVPQPTTPPCAPFNSKCFFKSRFPVCFKSPIITETVSVSLKTTRATFKFYVYLILRNLNCITTAKWTALHEFSKVSNSTENFGSC